MLKILISIFLVLSKSSFADINFKMYSCNERKNKLFISFNHKDKTALVAMGEPNKFSIQMDFIYWNSVSYENDNTLLRSFIFHKPTGKMSVNILKTVSVNKKIKFYKCILSE